MLKRITRKLVLFRNYLVYKRYAALARITNKPMPADPEAKFVVSIASYPKRDPLVPAVFQALSRQTIIPQKWILVLSVEDYPNGLPKHLSKLEKRGVEILWVEDNPYAVKKLVPTLQKCPSMDIITFDDELIYGESAIEKLVLAQSKHPGAIIGHVGKELWKCNGKLEMFCRSACDATFRTSSNQVYFLGGSGTYYPTGSLDDRVKNLEAIHKIVPGRGSDIWFWAAAVAKGSTQICLGSKPNLSLYFAIPETKITKPLDQPGKDMMETRFQMAVDYFEIRERLLEVLPEK